MRSILTVVAVAVVMCGAALAQEEAVYDIGNGVLAPRLVKEVKPNYPESAMRRRVEGRVEMSAVVLTDGRVGDDVTVTTSLDPDLDSEAVRTVKLWQFKPGTKDGKPVRVRINIELTFSLKKKSAP